MTRTEPRPVVNVRTSDCPDGGLIVQVYTGPDPDQAPGHLTVRAQRVRFLDARNLPEIFWHSVARRMDDAYNEGLPLWAYLTREECAALTDDRTDVVPDHPSILNNTGREACDPRLDTEDIASA